MRDYGYEGLLYSHLILAWTDAIQGRFEECRSGLAEALELAERTGHPYVLGMGLSFGSAIWRDIGDARSAAEWASRSTAVCIENGFIFWLGSCLPVNGWLARLGGDRSGGLALMNQGIAIFRQIGARLNLPYFFAYLAEAYLEDGEDDLCLATVEEGLGLARAILADNLEPELTRLKGQVLAKRKMTAEAELLLKSSLRLAREQTAYLFELRSSLALGRFLIEGARSPEAHGILVEAQNSLPAPLLALKEGQAVQKLLTSSF